MLDNYKTENIADESGNVEKQQEALLMNKLAATGKAPPKPQSAFLQKKLQQRKFFDSGDYAMNQDKEKKTHQRPTGISPVLLGGKKPELPAALKQQQQQPQPTSTQPLASPQATGSPSDGDEEEEHLQIPRPDTVPQRKASILHPSAHSKLSPQPLIHHEHNDELLSSPQN